VGGVPAKEINKRFGEDDISFLEEHPFWNQSDDWLKKNVDSFDDINSYKKLFL